RAGRRPKNRPGKSRCYARAGLPRREGPPRCAPGGCYEEEEGTHPGVSLEKGKGRPAMFEDLLCRLEIGAVNRGVSLEDDALGAGAAVIRSTNPATGQPIAAVRTATAAEYDRVVDRASAAFRTWRLAPPPRRGEVVRQIGVALRAQKADLGLLVTLETGKIRSEGEGEVQEMIDMCDFAVGLSRQLYGLTIASERPRHRMMEQWHPLGPIGIITAFNFPTAVWA